MNFEYAIIVMDTIQIKLDIRVFDNEDWVPFKQVMNLLKDLDKYTPNVDLKEIAKNLEAQKNQTKKNLS